MRTFLKQWFTEDKTILQAIDAEQFLITELYGGVILHTFWKTMVRPGMNLDFSLQLPPEAPTMPQTPEAEEPEVSETLYENRIQYKVSYYRRHEFGGRSEFVSQSVYVEPIELEVGNEHEKVPVLEESKIVESPPDSAHRYDIAPTSAKGKLPKLRQADLVSEPVLKVHSPYLLNILKAVIECSAEP